MDVAGFVLARTGDAHKLMTSLKDRISNYRKGAGTFTDLSYSVDRLARHIAEVDNMLGKFSNVLPTNIAVVFNDVFVKVCETLSLVNSAIEDSFSIPFDAGGSGAVSRVLSNAVQIGRANALSAKMGTLQTKIDDDSTQLLILISMLANALKVEEQTAILTSNFANATATFLPKFGDLPIAETVKEVYKPAASTPAPTQTVRLNFDANDENGEPATQEGRLKRSVLFGDSSGNNTAASGAIKPPCVVVGMAGVGKTIALHGLGHDETVLKRFRDGVHYMTFGQGATLRTAKREIGKILTLTGASSRAESVKGSTSVKDAVDYAVPWFAGRACLFLVDDLWPVESSLSVLVQDLLQLLRGSPESRMVISTRSFVIATQAGYVEHFRPRHPLGPTAIDIFMAHASPLGTPQGSSNSTRQPSESVSKILSQCDGLPIALSVTGCAVAYLMQFYVSFENACDEYAESLNKKRFFLGEENPAGGTSLNAGIVLSLEYLEKQFETLKEQSSIRGDHSMANFYTSLCVLEPQCWVSVPHLSRLWRLYEDVALDIVKLFCGMSLASFRLRQSSSGSSEAGIVLHDLQLEFCLMQFGKTANRGCTVPYLARQHLSWDNLRLASVRVDTGRKTDRSSPSKLRRLSPLSARVPVPPVLRLPEAKGQAQNFFQ